MNNPFINTFIDENNINAYCVFEGDGFTRIPSHFDGSQRCGFDS